MSLTQVPKVEEPLLAITQGFTLLVPENQILIPIPVSDWLSLKASIQNASLRSSRFHLLGDALLCIGLSSLLTILTSSGQVAAVAWNLAVVATPAGICSLLAANFLRAEPLREMERIESRFRHSALNADRQAKTP